ncbi:MAG TPA: hypothetical protein VIS47_06390 [Nitrosopumilus sp.]
MSDEFLDVAKREINEEICGLESLLAICNDDHDVVEIISKFQKHTHKIMGVAPMMGNTSLGEVAKSLDSLLKKFTDVDVVGVFSLLSEILPFMRSLTVEPEFDPLKVNEKISKIENLLN